eukprot:403374470
MQNLTSKSIREYPSPELLKLAIREYYQEIIELNNDLKLEFIDSLRNGFKYPVKYQYTDYDNSHADKYRSIIDNDERRSKMRDFHIFNLYYDFITTFALFIDDLGDNFEVLQVLTCLLQTHDSQEFGLEPSMKDLKWLDEVKLNIVVFYSKYFDLTDIMYTPVRDEFSIVHLAISTSSYQCVMYFIEELGFKVDFYRAIQKLTLFHVVAKHVTHEFTDYDKHYLSLLIKRVNNLHLKNNFGKTIIKLAKHMNSEKNVKFLEEQMKEVIHTKIVKMTFLVNKIVQKNNGKLNQYIIREIYKYIDG